MSQSNPRLLLFAATTGYQIRVFADAARRLGMELVLATDRCHVLEDPWGDHAIPVRFEDAAASVERVAGEAAARPFTGIVAVGDAPAVLAAQAARRLGISFHRPAAARAAHDKFLARQLFQAAGLPVPGYFRAPLAGDPREIARRAAFPCVLKPLSLSASRGVIRANNPEEFAAAFHRIRKMLEQSHDEYLQVEDFIEGREFAVEGLVTHGQLKILAVFDKPDPLDGPFFEETIYVTPSRAGETALAAIRDAAARAVRALGLEHGPIHAELRYNQRGAWMLEVAARPIGGLCAKMLRFTGGMPLEELILRHAAGEDVSAAELADPASGVMMIPIPKAGVYQEVAGTERAAGIPGVEEVLVTAKAGQYLQPLPEGASYLGFIFARGDTPLEVEQTLRRAHAELRFTIATALPTWQPTA
ncbi:MAG TPA: ATP-grasp domain-containing protein [Bryobacteraceae bacterium]|nr:ATP-grasp domain-containing protein [Bryobacteraceae bacterium]